jgi:hypothetical protein
MIGVEYTDDLQIIRSPICEHKLNFVLCNNPYGCFISTIQILNCSSICQMILLYMLILYAYKQDHTYVSQS